MCLAVPGQILDIQEDDPLMRMGRVSFGGIIKTINLAYTPEAQVDDFVLVHVGFSISVINREEAAQVFKYLREMDELQEIEDSAE